MPEDESYNQTSSFGSMRLAKGKWKGDIKRKGERKGSQIRP